MRKRVIAIWAALTFGVAWLLFALIMPIFNEAKTTSTLTKAYLWLLIPIGAHAFLLIGGAIYSSWRKRVEVVMGILLGFGLEFGALLVVIFVIFAFSRY